ncbi:MAG: sugar porter family MFS transporter [Bifidobacteriaceae bacterium]|jgi:sugar porter (SP) family MFS transporter|nr:sugar porter family MFS transporter [Bifidobacteriaceae bacterium]
MSVQDGGAAVAGSAGSSSRRLGLVTVIATFGGLLFGCNTGVTNGALEPLRSQFGLTPFTEGFVTSILLVGAAIGAVIGGRLSDRLGRRRNILLLAVVFAIGTVGCASAPSWQVLAAFRFILGLAVGGASTTVPVYLAEISPVERRGSLVTRNELAIVSGQFAAFVINAIIYSVWGNKIMVGGTEVYAHPDIWRWMFLVTVAPAFVLFFGMLRMPESPRWLFEHGFDVEAFDVLRQVRSPGRAQTEFDDLRELVQIEQARAKQAVGWAALKVGWIRRLVFIGIGIAVTQQLTGINSVMYYGTELLQKAGFASNVAIIANTANGVVAVTGCVVGMAIMNRVNRRTMMTFGYAGMLLMHLSIGLSDKLLPAGWGGKPVVVMVCVVLFVLIMQATAGPLCWLLLSEIFPLKIRGFGYGISAFMGWMTNFTVAMLFPTLMGSVGIGNTYFVFAALAAVSLVFIRRWVPETRGKSLEQLEEEFMGAAPPDSQEPDTQEKEAAF